MKTFHMTTLYLFSSQRRDRCLGLGAPVPCIGLCPGESWASEPAPCALVGPHDVNGEMNTKLGMWGWGLFWEEQEWFWEKQNRIKVGGKLQGETTKAPCGLGEGLRGAWERGEETLQWLMEETERRSNMQGAAEEWVALLCLFTEFPFRFIWRRKSVWQHFRCFSCLVSVLVRLTPHGAEVHRPVADVQRTLFFKCGALGTAVVRLYSLRFGFSCFLLDFKILVVSSKPPTGSSVVSMDRFSCEPRREGMCEMNRFRRNRSFCFYVILLKKDGCLQWFVELLSYTVYLKFMKLNAQLKWIVITYKRNVRLPSVTC